jgi:cbb3-type cytochrome oxidase maturation protein
MNILFFLVPIALILAGAFVGAFIWAVRHGQFDDVHSPAVRMLLDEEDGDRTPERDLGAQTPEQKHEK